MPCRLLFLLIFAPVKALFLIGIICVFSACSSSPKVHDSIEGWGGQNKTLSAIDSLMWQQPDSALALLCRDVACNVSECSTDGFGDVARYVSTTEHDRHYYQLLLAELRYKNDSAQANRAELRQVVAYFDSLVRQAPPSSLRAKRGNPRGQGGLKTPNPTDDLFFLSARAHYINGVGYYEHDSVVEACREYLMALETMESHFGEKDLVGKKAKFMVYTYNRLIELFSAQFMMEPAIACGKQALMYCKIAPTSPFGVSNILYRLGKQFDKMREKVKAREYYLRAIEEMPDSNNLLYRDMISTKILCDYQLGTDIEQSIYALRQILSFSNGEAERLTRFLTIGAIFSEERIYDSALFYLNPVFKDMKDVDLRIEAAEYLLIIYDSLDNKEKSDECMRFLVYHKKTDGENKSLVSKLESIFQDYLNQKLEKQIDENRKEAVRKAISVIVPIAIVIVLVIPIMLILRNKKQLKKQQEEANRRLGETMQEHEKELRLWQAEAEKVLEERDKRHAASIEAERQAHRMEQAAISGRLKRKNQEVRELKGQIRQQKDMAVESEPAPSFAEEPICRLIMERVHDGQFKAQMDYKNYKSYALNDEDLKALRMATDRHFNHFTVRLAKTYPQLTRGDLDYCCLYLLGLTDADVSALMQRAYNTINERSSKLKRILGCNNGIYTALLAIANEMYQIE